MHSYEGVSFNLTPDKTIDNNLETCASTALGDDTWWRIELSQNIYVHTVVLETGPSFGCRSSYTYFVELGMLVIVTFSAIQCRYLFPALNA